MKMRSDCYRISNGVSKTDMQKTIAYLSDAAKLYDALPMQSMKCRAHMIRQLIAKLKSKIEANGK